MFMFSDHLLPFLRSNPSLCNFCLTSVIFQSLSKSTLHHWEENSAESETNGSLWWCKVRTVKTSQPSSLSLSVFDAKEIRFIKFFSVKSFFLYPSFLKLLKTAFAINVQFLVDIMTANVPILLNFFHDLIDFSSDWSTRATRASLTWKFPDWKRLNRCCIMSINVTDSFQQYSSLFCNKISKCHSYFRDAITFD